MATVEITISNKAKGSLVACEKFEISRELAHELIAKLEAMVADLPGQHHTTRTIRPDGATVVEINLKAQYGFQGSELPEKRKRFNLNGVNSNFNR